MNEVQLPIVKEMNVHRSPRTLAVWLVVLFGLVAVACGGATDVVAEPATAGEEAAVTETGDAPAAATGNFGGDFIDLNGQSIDLASFEGQDTVLWFWAPW